MSATDKKSLPKCWCQRLWWIGLLLFLLVAYLVLRNFEMGYWTFLLFLVMFLAGRFLILLFYTDNFSSSAQTYFYLSELLPYPIHPPPLTGYQLIFILLLLKIFFILLKILNIIFPIPNQLSLQHL